MEEGKLRNIGFSNYPKYVPVPGFFDTDGDNAR